ncbi:MAG: hypothetical protein ABJK43_17790 [Lentilitoribacter sp.]
MSKTMNSPCDKSPSSTITHLEDGLGPSGGLRGKDSITELRAGGRKSQST